MRLAPSLVLVAGVVLAGCSVPPSASMDDAAVPLDAGTDAAPSDATLDAGPDAAQPPLDGAPDRLEPDAAEPDASTALDAALTADAGAADATPPDATSPDATLADAAAAGDAGPSTSCEPDLLSGAGRLSLSQSSVVFPTGGLSEQSVLWLRNPGLTTTPAFSLTLVGPAQNEFTVAGCAASVRGLDPGEECTLVVTFQPQFVGLREATLSLDLFRPTQIDVALSGTGVVGGGLAVSEVEFDLPTTMVGRSTRRSITVLNRSAGTSAPLTVELAGADAGEFAIDNGCVSRTLAPNASCYINVTLAPTSLGAKQASLTVAGGPAGSVTSALSGAGGTAPVLEFCPATVSIDGARIPVDVTRRLIIRNTGGSAVDLQWTLTGPSALTHAPRCILAAPGHTCETLVRFQASTASNITATMRAAASTGGGAAATATITARSYYGPSLAFDLGAGATGVSVGALPVQSVAHLRLPVINLGDLPTGALAIFHSFRTSPSPYSVASTSCLGVILGPGQRCEVVLAVAPTAVGALSNRYDLRWQDTPTSTPTISADLGGISVAAVGFGPLRALPDVAVFGQVRHGSSATMTITLSNQSGQPTGAPTLVLGGAAAGDFQIDGTTCTATLAAGASCSVTVTFSPTRGGTRRATLTATSSVAGAAVVQLVGIGETQLVVTQSGFGYGTLNQVGGTYPGNCSLSCTFRVAADTLTYRAVPDPGSALVQWIGCDSVSGSDCTVAPSAPSRTITAEFSGPPRQISIVRSAGGTVTSSPAGLDCGSTCVATFAAGLVTLTPTVSPGKVFLGWSGPCAAAGTGPCTTSAGGIIRAAFADSGPCHVVLNEIGGYFRWVELYNPCAVPMSVNAQIAFRYSDNSAPASAPDDITLGSVSETIPSAGFLLVMPLPHQVPPFDGEDVTSGGVALRDTTTREIIDSMTTALAFGAFTETSPSTYLISSPMSSYSRFRDGIDSNDNSVDFVNYVYTPGTSNH